MSTIDVDDPNLVVEALIASTEPWNPDPDPRYYELKDEIEGMCLVITSWLGQIGILHRYTTMVRADLDELLFKLATFLSSLENPVPEMYYEDRYPNAIQDYYDSLKKQFADFKEMVANMQMPVKRLRRCPSGDELIEVPAVTGSTSSQRAPIVEVDAEVAAAEDQVLLEARTAASQAEARTTAERIAAAQDEPLLLEACTAASQPLPSQRIDAVDALEAFLKQRDTAKPTAKRTSLPPTQPAAKQRRQDYCDDSQPATASARGAPAASATDAAPTMPDYVEIPGTQTHGHFPDGPGKLYRSQEDVFLGQKRPDGGMKMLKIFPGGWAQYKAGRKLFLM